MTEPIDYTEFNGIMRKNTKKLSTNQDGKLNGDETFALSKTSVFTVKQDAIKDYRPKCVPEKIYKPLTKQEIINGLANKWSKKFPQSPLKQDFYNKLYDVAIKKMNCMIADEDFRPDLYDSKEEQTMDEVIAVLAGESQLNPESIKVAYDKNPKTGKVKQIIYYGLFQMNEQSLSDAKALVETSSGVSLQRRLAKEGIKQKDLQKINPNLEISKFVKLSGIEQLDYLLAHITNSKCYSKLAGKKITPAQFWTMIKLPFQGQNSKEVSTKSRAIENVFNGNGVKKGIEKPNIFLDK